MKVFLILFLVINIIGCASFKNDGKSTPELVCHDEYDMYGHITKVCEPRWN